MIELINALSGLSWPGAFALVGLVWAAIYLFFKL